MKKLLLLAGVLLSLCSYAQTKASRGNLFSKTNKHTPSHVTFQLDLCRPEGTGFTTPGISRKRMVVKNNETVSFELIHINPFKYEVKVDNKPVANHMDGDAFIDSLNGRANRTKNPTQAMNATSPLTTDQAAQKLKDMFSIIYKLRAMELRLSAAECYDSEAELVKITELYSTFQEGLVVLDALTKIDENQLSRYQLTAFITTGGDTTAAGHLRIQQTEAKFREFAKLQQARYITMPVAPNGNIDYIQFEVSKTLRGTTTTEKQSYEVWVRGGIKIDFSASAWGTGLIDEKYALKDVRVDGAERKQILKQDEGKFILAFGSQVNCLLRTGAGFIRPGFSLGMAFTGDANFQLMPGVTILMGKASRFGLTGGVAFGKVQRMDAAYEVGGYYDGSSSTLPTVNKFTYAPFAGITYNLGQPREQDKEKNK